MNTGAILFFILCKLGETDTISRHTQNLLHTTKARILKQF